jgi:hypothetical protein
MSEELANQPQTIELPLKLPSREAAVGSTRHAALNDRRYGAVSALETAIKPQTFRIVRRIAPEYLSLHSLYSNSRQFGFDTNPASCE